MSKSVNITDLRARLLIIVGQAQNLNMLLGDVSCPDKRLLYVNHCTEHVCRDLQRLTHVLAHEIEEEKNNAARNSCRR